MTTEKVSDYIGRLKARGCSGGTINRHVAAISVLSKHADHLGLVSRRPLLQRQKEGTHRIRHFSRAEEEAIFSTLVSWGMEDIHRFFVFIVDTGARPGEALAMLPSRDINHTTRTVTLEGTKNELVRTLPLTERAYRAALPGFRALSYAHVSAVWERLRSVLPFLHEDTVIYTFRHTCAFRLAERGTDLVRIKEWMGHKSIATTLRYAHLSPKRFAGMVDILEAA
jgi:integrase